METNKTNWAVIYSPREGFASNHRKWRKIREYMKEQGISFDYVQSEGRGTVVRLAKMMAENRYKTIIVVGGDGALNEAVNGIMLANIPLSEKPSLGVIPCGVGNDFAKYWGYSEGDFKRTIQFLLVRRIRRIDVGCLEYDYKDRREKRFFINCVNIGMVSSIMGLKYHIKNILGIRTLAYFISAFILLFRRMVYKMEFELNSEIVERKAMNLCIGSARGYGMTPSAVPYNGHLDVSLVSHPEISGLIQGVWLFFTGRFLSHKNVTAWRTRSLVINKVGRATVSIDGRGIKKGRGEMYINIQPEILDFIIP